MTCTAPGWGTGPYGTTPWGGGLGAVPGGPIPTVPPYDVYCVGPCGPMSVILTFDEVEEFGDALQLTVDGPTQDLVLSSGGGVSSDNTYIHINTTVPGVFTHEYTVKFNTLPTNFVDVVHKHIAIGAFNSAGASISLFFSKIGIAYSGSFHYDGSDDLTLDTIFQPLPNSQTLISENEYYTVRIALDYNIHIVYVYITKTADLPFIGHQLKYILPTVNLDSYSVTPADGTWVSVRGSLGSPSILSLDTICLSSQFIVPNIPPVADAGLDQAARLCSVTQLDGSKSFDPEGTPITYKWRLIDAPVGSEFMYDGGIGHTIPLPIPTGFTNKFYSDELNDLDAIDELLPGEVLSVGGEVYDVTGKGTDGEGFFITIEGFILPDNITGLPYKYLRQRGFADRTITKPKFLPDKPGIFRFDLTVSDGYLLSEPSVMIINVTESPIPRGCIPDLRFLWDYLSDFWKLVEDKERIEVFWGSLAQMAASELLNIWQVEYSKSLRDIQRTAQRRWLHYDCLVKEPFPDLTTVKGMDCVLYSDLVPYGGINANGVPLLYGLLQDEEVGKNDRLGPIYDLLPARTAEVIGEDPMSPEAIAAQLNGSMKLGNPAIRVLIQPNTLGDYFRFFIVSPTLVAIKEDAPDYGFLNGGGTGVADNTFRGNGTGTVIGPYTYKSATPIKGVDLVDKYLVLGENSITYRDATVVKIKAVTSHPSDPEPNQRIITYDPIPEGKIFSNWLVGTEVRSTQLDFYALLAFPEDQAIMEVFDNETNQVILQETNILGTYEKEPNLLLIDARWICGYMADPERYTIHFHSFRRRSYIPIDDIVTDIPYLQEKIKSEDDTAVLRRNIDFVLQDGVRGRRAIHISSLWHPIGMDINIATVWGFESDEIRWENPPPDRLWAEVTYLDNSNVIEQNFGYPAEFTLDDLSALPSSVDYLSAVRGLWYSYFKGPTLFNLRVGTQILLGLPFAEEAGTITEIRTDYSPKQGRILIQDTAHPEITRSYTFPLPLEPEENPDTGEKYKLGDTVHPFAPLVTGAEVSDYIKDPTWFEGFLNQGLMYEVEKFFRFLTRVDSAAFNLSALLFVKSFILRIKPTYTYPYFVVQRKIDETEVSTTDLRTYDGLLMLHDGACTQQNDETMWGVATMFDEPDPSGGGWQSQFDSSSDPPDPAPTFDVAQAVQWGYDKNLLCPEDSIVGAATIVYAVPTIPTFDSIFSYDNQPFNAGPDLFWLAQNDITHVPAGEGLFLTGLDSFAYTGLGVDSSTDFSEMEVIFDGYHNGPVIDYEIVLYVNGFESGVFAVTPPDGHSVTQFTTGLAPFSDGDIVTAKLRHNEVTHVSPTWETVMVKFGVKDPAWDFDDTIPAGTYSIYRDL